MQDSRRTWSTLSAGATALVLVLGLSGLGMTMGLSLGGPAGTSRRAGPDVAVVSVETDAPVQQTYQGDVRSLARQPTLDVRVVLRNGGAQTAGPLRLELTVLDQNSGRLVFRDEKNVPTLSPGRQLTLTFPGVPANEAGVNRVTAVAGQAKGDVDGRNNTRSFRYVMPPAQQ